jgi:hypothetical protein
METETGKGRLRADNRIPVGIKVPGFVLEWSRTLKTLIYPVALQHSTEQHQQTNRNNTQDRCHTLPNETNPTTNTTETTDKQQLKQQAISVKNTLQTP